MSEEGDFIHDILTPLAVAHAHVRIMRETMHGDQSQVDAADMLRRIDRSFDALERLVAMVTARRDVLAQSAED